MKLVLHSSQMEQLNNHPKLRQLLEDAGWEFCLMFEMPL